jgi:hypothetical protein
MRGAIPRLPQYIFMAWIRHYDVVLSEVPTQLYLYLTYLEVVAYGVKRVNS